jgi:hypothetical protein
MLKSSLTPITQVRSASPGKQQHIDFIYFFAKLLQIRTPMAKTNYTFEKRQKELAKQKKQAEKLLKKAAGKSEPTDQPTPPADDQIES